MTAPPRLSCLSASELQHTKFPPARYVVPGLLPEGVVMLGGRPKIGKSWLALDAAYAVASGGLFLGAPAEQGPVLYLGLEDNARRMQGRLNRLLDDPGALWPDALHFAFGCPRMDKGGLDVLRAELDARRPRLIIIDTFQKVRHPRRGADAYAEDYDAVATVQPLAFEHEAAFLLVAHTRKKGKDEVEPDDPLDEINGTTGLTGPADAVVVLSRKRHGDVGKLFVTGRDIEERTVPLAWDAASCRWARTGDEDDGPQPSADQAKAVAFAEEAGRPVTLEEMRAIFPDKSYDALCQMAGRIVKAGLLHRTSRGHYATPAVMARELFRDN